MVTVDSDTPPQVCLIVDDSLTVRRGLRLALEKAGLFSEILEADDGDVALSLLDARRAEHRPGVDLVLVDLVMPRMDGFDFLEAFKRSPERALVPVIVLTGQESTKKKVRALEAGAADYLVKPFDNAELVARVRVHLKVKNLQDELRELNRRLQTLTLSDPVTGLPKQSAFDESLEREVARARRHGTRAALLVLDIDRLGDLNDRIGRLAADEVFAALAARVRATLRKTDTLGRHEGATLTALLPGTARVEAAAVGEKLRAVIADRPLVGQVSVTVAVGAACYPEMDIADAAELLRAAHQALAEAKRLGGNRVAMWLGELGSAASVCVQE